MAVMLISSEDGFMEMCGNVRRSVESVNTLFGAGDPVRIPDRDTLVFSTLSADSALQAVDFLRGMLKPYVEGRRVAVSPAGVNVVVSIMERRWQAGPGRGGPISGPYNPHLDHFWFAR